ncbi:hypothetical protein [Sphingomonas mollis]|uniref:hypothetical protein n=1 Tax=Sphingomonas mollis TaxID=2795726 RepID=UPI001E2F54AB|nr:hypothetical protein [Sphingomonas sp. BT553]
MSHKGPWFQRPYICIPASTGEGSVTVLVGVDQWQSALNQCAGDVRLASQAVFEQAETRGQWRYYEGQPAILVA